MPNVTVTAIRRNPATGARVSGAECTFEAVWLSSSSVGVTQLIKLTTDGNETITFSWEEWRRFIESAATEFSLDPPWAD